MGLALLSVLYERKSIKEIQVIDKETLKVRKIQSSDIIKVLKVTNIEGIFTDKEGLVGTNGSLSRYADYNDRLVVLYKTDNGFILADKNGNVRELDNKEALRLAKVHHLSNGKVVTTEDGSYISSISGVYESIKTSKGSERHGRERKDGCGSNGRAVNKEGTTGRVNTNGDMYTGFIQGGKEGRQGTNNGGHTVYSVHDGLDKVGYTNNVAGEDFYDYIKTAKDNNKHGKSVDCHTILEYKDMNCITLDGGKAGVAIHNGDIVSVFKSESSSIKGAMLYLMTSAILNGGDRLDCYSIKGALPSLYVRHGFIPVCKIKFNREFADPDWNYERDGEPDIVFMAYCGDSLTDMQSKTSKYKQYGDYKSSDVPYIHDKDGKCAYEIAQEVRDNYIRNLKGSTKEVNTKEGYLSGKVVGFKQFIKSMMRGRNKRE